MKRLSILGGVSVAVAVGLAGCGGSSNTQLDDMTPPPPVSVTLPSDHGLAVGELEIPAGGHVERGNVRFSCPETSTSACMVTLTDSVGTLIAHGTGGVTVSPWPAPPTLVSVPLPEDRTGLAVGELTIPAGQSEDRGNVRFSCPATSTSACMVTVTDSAGTLFANGTGGVTAASIGGATAETNFVRLVRPDDLDLVSRIPVGETVNSPAIAPGDSWIFGNTRFQCENTEAQGNCHVRLERTGESGNDPIKSDRSGDVVAIRLGQVAVGTNELGDPIRTNAVEALTTNTNGVESSLNPTPNTAVLWEAGNGVVRSVAAAGDPVVGAWIRPTLDGLRNGSGNAGYSGQSGEKDGPRYDARYSAPAIDDPTGVRKWGTWSTSVAHMGTVAGNNPYWRDPRVTVTAPVGFQANVALDSAVAGMNFEQRMSVRQQDPLLTRALRGDRTAHIDLYTDLGRTKPTSTTVQLKGFDYDAGTDLEVRNGTMHTDWRRGPDLVSFTSRTSPHDLGDGEWEVFGRIDERSGAKTADGTYRGIRGKFTCVDTNCRILNQDGRLLVHGDFTFTPANDQSVWDPDYLAIGIWRVVPDDPAGDYQAGAFAFGNDPFNNASMAAATGTARYEGPAYGLYTERVDEASEAQAGRFAARATLNAEFESSTVMGTISGRVHSFTGVGHDLSAPITALNLNVNSAPIGVFRGNNNEFQNTIGGQVRGRRISGSLHGQFYGGKDNAAGQPGYAAGTFGAEMASPAHDGYDLNLFGAFGAERK